MTEDFPRLRQPPGSNSCFSIAVRAVLLWWGENVTHEEVREWCQESRDGCVLDLALEGLREAGLDIEELNALTEEEAQELLRITVTDEDHPQPVIVTLRNPRWPVRMDHAVVVTNIRQEQTDRGTHEIVEYMDPLTGEIEQDASGRFWRFWYHAQFRAIMVRP